MPMDMNDSQEGALYEPFAPEAFRPQQRRAEVEEQTHMTPSFTFDS